MPVDVKSAETFVLANARVLERHRMAALLHGGGAAPVLAALRAYRNPDGGFGHALEPDVRAPESEPAATLAAVDVLAEVGASGDEMVAAAGAWIASIAAPDGGVPFVMPTAARAPHAPWMVPVEGGSQLTFPLVAALLETGAAEPWLSRASEWCWARLERTDELGGYVVKFALTFLDAVPDERRAADAIERLRARIGDDGTLPVPGGTEDERLMPLTLSPSPGSRSRALFTAGQIEHDLDRLEQGQQEDGGWMFDWLAWSPGQTVEWRGILTVLALGVLSANGRIELP
jgi:hypothetical protein